MLMMSEIKKKHECIEIIGNTESIEYSKIAKKFRVYRLSAESADKKLREAETVIDQMKKVINFSRDVEKNLRSQISFAQDRLISFQMILKKFVIISEQQRKNEKKTEQIEHAVEELKEKINRTRQESQNTLNFASRDINFLKKIKNLESILTVKNSEYDLLKMENLTLTKEKLNMETEKIKQFQKILKNLEIELEKSVKQKAEAQTHCRETLLYYKQQIEDYEEKIKRYEKERQSFLEDFDFPENSKTSSKFTWADSTVTINAEERTAKTSPSKNLSFTEMEPNTCDTQIFQCSPFQKKPKILGLKKGKDFVKTLKQKPQLDFLTESQDSFQPVTSMENTRKKRLFSTNCNHYID